MTSILEKHYTNDFEIWLNSDDVVKVSLNCYIEQTTQWKKEFTYSEIRDFFTTQYVND